MSGTPDIHGLARQFAVLEERMKTMQMEYRTDIAHLAEAMARRDGELKETMARRDGELKETMARGDGELRADQQAGLRQQLIAVIGIVALGFAALGFFLTQLQPTVVTPPPVIIHTAPETAQAPAGIRTAPEGFPDAAAAEPIVPTVSPQPDG